MVDWAALLQNTGHPSYPRVRQVVGELQRDYARWLDKVREFELATTASSASEPNPDAEVLQQELQALAVDIQSYVAEINYLGVPLKVQDLFDEV